MTYYYARLNTENVCVEIYEDEVEVDENGFIPIESADYDLIGLWYDIETQSFMHLGHKYMSQIKAIDGSGSGLDADKLDGKSSEEFALAGHTHTGFAPLGHSHTPADIGAASANHSHDSEYAFSSHSHTPAEIGSAPEEHTHTPSEIGASPATHTHTPAGIGAATAEHTHTAAAVGAAEAAHNHDGTYSPATHTHTPADVGAATADHTHTPAGIGAAPATHSHDGVYSAFDHTHTPTEVGAASADHTHTLASLGAAASNHAHTYSDVGAAASNHTHTLASLGAAAASHNHDSAYAAKSHTHSDKANDNEVVHIAGAETITGTKTFTANPIVNKSNANVILKASDLTKGSLPTVASYDGVAVQDKNGNVLSNIRYAQETDGDAYIQLKVCDYRGDAADYTDVRIYKTVDGQKYVQLPTHVKLSNGLQAIYSNTNMQFGSASMDTLIHGKNDVYVQTRMNSRSIIPNANDTYQIGNASNRFKTVYLTSAANVSSDERLKQDIVPVDKTDMFDFIEKLNVVNYKFMSEPDVERIGLIAQAVESAGGEKFVEVGEDGMYGLKPADLVYPLICAVQKLSERVKELENRQ